MLERSLGRLASKLGAGISKEEAEACRLPAASTSQRLALAPPSVAVDAWQRGEQQNRSKGKRVRGGGNSDSDGDRGDDVNRSAVTRKSEWGEFIGPHLSKNVPQVHKQLRVPSGLPKRKQAGDLPPGYLWVLWLTGSWGRGRVGAWEQLQGGSKRAKGATAQRPLVPSAEEQRRLLSLPVDDPRLLSDVWRLPVAVRQRLADRWRAEVRAGSLGGLADQLAKANELQLELMELCRYGPHTEVLRCASSYRSFCWLVLSCSTCASAKLRAEVYCLERWRNGSSSCCLVFKGACLTRTKARKDTRPYRSCKKRE
jgi:hypothetical protein